MVDIAYGGENGFSQAIQLSADILQDVKFVKEKKLITKYFDEVAQDTGKICFGVDDTIRALDAGAVSMLIVHDQIAVNRYELRNPHTSEENTLYLRPDQEKDPKHFKDEEGRDLDVVDKKALSEWLVENYKNFGAKLEFVTDKSQEGSQFVKGFGGIGGMMRYQMSFDDYEDMANDYD